MPDLEVDAVDNLDIDQEIVDALGNLPVHELENWVKDLNDNLPDDEDECCVVVEENKFKLVPKSTV